MLRSYIIFSSEQLHHLQWNCLWFTSVRERKIKLHCGCKTEAATCRCDVTKVGFCWLVGWFSLFVPSASALSLFSETENSMFVAEGIVLFEGENGFYCFETVFLLQKKNAFRVVKEKYNFNFSSGLKMFQENICFAWKCNSCQNRENQQRIKNRGSNDSLCPWEILTDCGYPRGLLPSVTMFFNLGARCFLLAIPVWRVRNTKN